MGKIRTVARIDIRDVGRFRCTCGWPSFLVRRVIARCARGKSPALYLVSPESGRRVTVEPGTIEDFLVAAYEGARR
jgi:hypothetical protein